MAGVAVAAAATQVAATEEEEEEEEKKVRDSRRRVRLPLRTTLPRFFPSLFSFSIQLCSLSLSRASRQPWSPKRRRIKGRVRSLSRSLSLSLFLRVVNSTVEERTPEEEGEEEKGRKKRDSWRILGTREEEERGEGGGEEDGAFRFRGFVVGDFGYKSETFDPKAENCPKIRDISYQLTERERAR